MSKAKPDIGHLCPECINAVFWAHREALDKVLDIANTPGEDESVKYDGMVDAAFDCLSFFDSYYEGCLRHKSGTLKENEVWVPGKQKAEEVRKECQHGNWIVDGDRDVCGKCGSRANPVI